MLLWKKASVRRAIQHVIALLLCVMLIGGVIGPYHAKAATEERYVVIVVDTSGESYFIDTATGERIFSAVSPITEVKKAAVKFVEELSKVPGTHVSVVSYGRYGKLELEFSSNYSEIKTSINNLSMIGGRKNMKSGLDIANEQLNQITDSNAKKAVILVSPGMTDEGDYDYTGHWNTSAPGSDWYNLNSGINYYAYANSAYLTAEAIKAQGADIYTIGLLKMMEDCPDLVKGPAEFFQVVLQEFASEGCYYPVYDVDDFEFVFASMGQEIITGNTGNFKFAATGEKDNYTSTFYFEDAYFDRSATEYNPSLATMSLCLAMSSFGANGAELNTVYCNPEQASFDQTQGVYRWPDGSTTTQARRKHQWANAYELLDAIGFEHIEANEDFYKEPGTNTMGVIVGMKTIKMEDEEYTLIALATRGANYYSEWAGNFRIGITSNHAGFEIAKNVAKNFLNDYISERQRNGDIKGTAKLWMAGYSRGGATVNLLAGEITRERRIGKNSEVMVSPNNIFAYCFEPPRGLMAISEEYARSFDNIFNIVNPNDIVPLVAMNEWGFMRYGVDVYLPSSEYTHTYNVKAAHMMEYYSKFNTVGVRKSILSFSEYEAQRDDVIEGVKTIKTSLYNAMEDRYPHPEGYERPDYFAPIWEDLKNGIYAGVAVISNDSDSIDLRDFPGYGVFDSVYEFLIGLEAARNHCSALDATGRMLTDKVSLVDLFYVGDLGATLLTSKGLRHVEDRVFVPIYENAQMGNVGRRVVNGIARSIDREEYEEWIQDWLCKLLQNIMKKDGLLDGYTPKKSSPVTKKIIGLWKKLAAIDLITIGNVDLDILVAWPAVIKTLKDDGVDINGVLSGYERDTMKEGVLKLVRALVKIAKEQEGSNALYSLLLNKDKLGMAHYPELCLAWLQSQDSNYDAGNQRLFVPHTSRVIRINCPVDVDVYDSKGNLVAQIINNTPKSVDGSSITYAFTENGEKTISLPIDESYHAVFTSTDDGTLNISLNHLDIDGQCSYIENYYDIVIEQGDVVTMDLPKEYFVDDEGIEHVSTEESVVISHIDRVVPSVVLQGDDAKTALYQVKVSNQNPQGGVCLGGGEYLLGSYAMVSAAECEDCEFLGWYEDEILVSQERNYRFRVTTNRELTAAFEGTSQYGKNGIFEAELVAEVGGGIFGETHISALDGYPFEIVAVPFDGYEFVGWETTGNCIIDDAEAETTMLTLVDEDVSIVAKFKEEEVEKPIEDQDEHEDGYYYISEGIAISYRTTAVWTGGYNGEIVIRNNTGKGVRT